MSDWTCKNHYPNLADAHLIAFDTETKDPFLREKGPGEIRKDGYIVGFSLATDTGFKGYYPLRHEGGGNVEDPAVAVRWLQEQLNLGIPITGANLPYDIGWAKTCYGFDVSSPLWDVQVADPLLDENWPSYRLNEIAKRRLGIEKDQDVLYKQGAEFLKFHCRVENAVDRDKAIADHVKGNLWRLPAAFVGAYGEADADLCIKIFLQQKKELEALGLWPTFQLECDVQRVLIKMRRHGVRVDLQKAEQAAAEMDAELETEMQKIENRVGFRPDLWAAESVGKACATLGLSFPRTASRKNKKGEEVGSKPSFTADWLEVQEHPLFKLIRSARQMEKSGGKYIRENILGCAINGRIHTSLHQVMSERGGAKSFRFSSSNPNLQQVAARNENLAPRIRGLFPAELGCFFLCKDVAQQEPRFIVHYADLLGLRGAAEAREGYKNDPTMSYHKYVQKLTGLEYSIAKQLNLGLGYGMGIKKFSEKYGVPYQDAAAMFDTYHEKLPFVRALTRHCENTVKMRGYLRSHYGHHCHFNLYGPAKFQSGEDTPPLHKEEAIAKYGTPVTQYFTYRAMNRLIQSSSAGMIKRCMVDCDKAGYLCDLTVHDELDFAGITDEKAYKEIDEIMCASAKLTVPILLDTEVGPDWGHLEKIKI